MRPPIAAAWLAIERRLLRFVLLEIGSRIVFQKTHLPCSKRKIEHKRCIAAVEKPKCFKHRCNPLTTLLDPRKQFSAVVMPSEEQERGSCLEIAWVVQYAPSRSAVFLQPNDVECILARPSAKEEHKRCQKDHCRIVCKGRSRKKHDRWYVTYMPMPKVPCVRC